MILASSWFLLAQMSCALRLTSKTYYCHGFIGDKHLLQIALNVLSTVIHMHRFLMSSLDIALLLDNETWLSHTATSYFAWMDNRQSSMCSQLGWALRFRSYNSLVETVLRDRLAFYMYCEWLNTIICSCIARGSCLVIASGCQRYMHWCIPAYMLTAVCELCDLLWHAFVCVEIALDAGMLHNHAADAEIW